MKRISALVVIFIALALVFLMDNDKYQVPPLGKMLSPTHGLWKNAVTVKPIKASKLTVKTPHGPVNVYFDDRSIPHLFAPNENALYYAQGYVQARDRLWQMDFQVRIAEGRLSEIIGEDGLDYDRFFRRIGIPKASEEIVEVLLDDEDAIYKTMVQAYADGINSYIKSLSPGDYPMEYKLADYAPEMWTLKKSLLLLKLMALRLSGFDTDVENSNLLKIMDVATFNSLYPDFPKDQSPIIPSGTPWKFKPVAVPAYTAANDLQSNLFPDLNGPFSMQHGIGSNNWAVGKSKTADGGAILCNDPHLGLTFPSIWYEMHLNTPEMNVYGVTIPGSPCIIIGFNNDIAWGVTNGSRDVRDWFSVQYKDDNQDEYLFENEYLTVEHRIERIAVKDKDDIVDTVKWTVVGPVMYDDQYGDFDENKGLAMYWLALDVSNEVKTFYSLNKARDHEEYLGALDHYANPAQNFVFADRMGNIAIKEQGKFRVKDRNTGKFVEKLDEQTMASLQTYIPNDHNPHVLNPSRGFVSSANQHPTDSTYPYQYSGWFETYRNRRINTMLDSLEDITVDDMKQLQNDVYNLMGEEMLPYLINTLDQGSLDESELAILDSLDQWDHTNQYTACAPSYFQQWWKNVMEAVWDELQDSTVAFRIPRDYHTFNFIRQQPDHEFIDNKSTSDKETVSSIVNEAFVQMTDYFNGEGSAKAQWRFYNGSSVEHLMGLDALSAKNLAIGGSENSINANLGNFGPSWRMIVRLNTENIEAYAVYPGGQNGNPADPDYDAFLDEWAAGKYFKLNFYSSEEEAKKALKL